MADVGQALQAGAAGAGSGAALGTSIMPGYGTAIGAAGGAILGAIPALLGDSNEEYNKKRLAELMHLQSINALGLTPNERETMFNAQMAQQQTQIDKMSADRDRQLASAVTQGAGQAFSNMATDEDAAAAARSRAAANVDRENAIRKQELERELAGLSGAVGQTQKNQQSAVANAGIGILGSVTDQADTNLMTGGPAVNRDAQVASFSQKYGLSTEAAAGALDAAQKNPSLLDYFMMLGRK